MIKKIQRYKKIWSLLLLGGFIGQTQAGIFDNGYINTLVGVSLAAALSSAFLWHRNKKTVALKPLVVSEYSYSKEEEEISKVIERSLIPEIEIVQLPVCNQTGAYCGYHALQNGMLMFNGVDKDHYNLEDLSHKKSIQEFGTQGDLWRIVINQKRNKPQGSGEWLDDVEVDKLVDVAMGDKRDKFTVNADKTLLCDSNFGQGLSIQKIKKDLNNLNYNSPVYKHVFILGTMKSNRVEDKQGGSGHWYTVMLLQQHGKRTYFVADSMQNTDRRRSEQLYELIKAIEGEEVAKKFN